MTTAVVITKGGEKIEQKIEQVEVEEVMTFEKLQKKLSSNVADFQVQKTNGQQDISKTDLHVSTTSLRVDSSESVRRQKRQTAESVNELVPDKSYSNLIKLKTKI